MKHRIITLLSFLSLGATALMAQDVNARLEEAGAAWDARRLDDARFALQAALGEINKAIGQEMLLALPLKLEDMDAQKQDDQSGGAAGIAGIFVARSWAAASRKARVDILGDSPLLAGINALLSMPLMGVGGDPGQKRVKVGGYKALLTKDSVQDEAIPVYTLQLPVNQTLLSFRCEGIADEAAVLRLAGLLPLEAIASLSR